MAKIAVFLPTGTKYKLHPGWNKGNLVIFLIQMLLPGYILRPGT
jgi:hypothetical protein